MSFRPAPSIRRRLLGLICGLLLAVVAIGAITSYREVRRSALHGAADRLGVVSKLLQDALAGSVQQLRVGTEALAASPTVVAYLRDSSSRSAAVRDSALGAMHALRASGAAGGERVALWDAAARRVLATSDAPRPVESSEIVELIARLGTDGRSAVGRFRIERDTLLYPAIARVTAGSETIGYVVHWRRIAGSATTRSMLSELIGSDARVLIGNADDGTWSDFASHIAAPEIDSTPRAAGLGALSIAGAPQVAAVRRIAATPWTLVIAFPEAEVLARPRVMLGRFALYAAILVLLGGAGAWVLSGRLTGPLGELVDAATAIGGGDYARRVVVRRRDEVGRLGEVFNRMTEQVAANQHELAMRSEELQQQAVELEITNEQLQQQAVELETSNEQLQHQAIELETTVEQLRETERELEGRTAAAEASEARVRTVLESISEAFYALDADWRFTYLNPQAESLLRIRASKLLGLDFWQRFPHLIGGPFDREYRRAAESGLPVTFVEYVDRLDAWLESTVYPAADGGVAVYFRDVSERVTRERALAESERRYRLMFEQNPMPMWVVDAESLTFLAVNDAAVEHYGWTREEFLAISLRDLHPADVRERLPLTGPWRPGRMHLPDVQRHLTRDGRELSVDLTFYGLEWGGRPARLVLINDLTERLAAEEALRESEAQLRQAQKMEAIGQLAGGIAHDFNNLLTVITSYGGLLLRETSPEDQNHADLVEIRDAAERAATLTRQLLAFSRQQVLQPQVLDLNVVTRDMEKLLRRLLREDLRLETRLAPALGRVHADPGQVEQVIMNLVVNARDAMPDGGGITIETSSAELEASLAVAQGEIPPGRYVALEVRDEGIGMDPATQARMYDPFFTTKEVGKGTGLGLSTAYGIMRQTGGFIECESVPGEGTTFRLYFPVADGEAASGRTRVASEPSPSGSETILLVEDEAPVRTVAARILRASGYTVLEARDGGEALNVWATAGEGVDLVITDMVMPNMGGRELASRIRSRRPDAPLLFLSGYTEDAAQQRSFLAPGDLFLDKPFSEATLATKVREALDRRSRL